MNNHTIIGRLTRDPELKFTQSSKPVVKFTIAVNRRFDKDKADFFNCEAWNKAAEIIAQYATKGSMMMVSGEHQNETFISMDGEKKNYYKINVDQFEFLSKATKSESSRDMVGSDDLPF